MKRLLVLLALSPLVARCSPPDLGTDAAVKVCDAYANAYCMRKQACSAALFSVDFPDYATCKLVQTDQCVNEYLAPGSTGLPSFLANCTADLTSPAPTWACQDFLNNTNPSTACTFVGGSLPDGTPCTKSSQCKSDWCPAPPGVVCGVCTELPQAGGICRNAQGETLGCPLGLYCNDKNVCTQYAQLNGACGADQACEAGNACVGGTCIAGQSKAGLGCGGTSGQGCSTLAGLDCNNQTQACEPFIVVGPGQPCGSNLFNQQYVHCGGAAQCVSGTCVAVAGLGQACDLLAGPSCLGPSRCIVTADGGTSGVCVITDATSCN